MLIKITIRRIFELMMTCAIASAIITFFNIGGILTTTSSIRIALVIGLAAFVLINVLMLRQFYLDFRNNITYFLVNIVSYLTFVEISLAVYNYCSSELYAWIFSITKFAKYWYFAIDNLLSLFIFHIIGFLATLLAPIGMSWVFLINEEEEFEKELYENLYEEHDKEFNEKIR